MSWLEALILGIIQGLTEFIPVSSDGHLELGKILLGSKDQGTFFIIIVHAGTMLSTLVVFWREILKLLVDLFKFEWNESTKFVSQIVVSMIPAAVVGLAFKHEIDALFTGKLWLVGLGLLGTAALLFFANFREKEGRSLTYTDAFIMGIAQAFAILPGLSRSGSTISSALILGVARDKAASFSFLMVLPLIAGKVILDTKDYLGGETGGVDPGTTALVIGFVSSFLVGLMACKLMIEVVKKSGLFWFALYCTIVGGLAFGIGIYKLYA